MKNQMRNPAVYLFASLLVAINVSAAEESVIKIRPHVGLGDLDGKAYQHAGVRLLLDANSSQKYGFELTKVRTRQDNYVAAGIVLEKRMFGWFNLSIGTIGYFRQGQGSRNYPGLVANLGWEPPTTGAIKPFVTYRNDTIFADKTLVGNALSAGFLISF